MRETTILDTLEATAARLPDKTAVIADGQAMRYETLMATARTIGYGINMKISGGGYALTVDL